MKVEILITPRKELLDPQGKTTEHALHNIGLRECKNLRVGKVVYLEIDGDDKEKIIATAQKAADELLANPVMEDFKINLMDE